MAVTYKPGQGDDPFPGTSPHPRQVLEQVARWLATVGKTLIPAWEVRLSAGIPTSDTARAESFFRDDAHEIVVALGPTFFEYSEMQRRACLVHELLHAVFHPITKYSREATDNELGARWQALFEMTLGGLEEVAVDDLSKAIAIHFPATPEAE